MHLRVVKLLTHVISLVVTQRKTRMREGKKMISRLRCESFHSWSFFIHFFHRCVIKCISVVCGARHVLLIFRFECSKMHGCTHHKNISSRCIRWKWQPSHPNTVHNDGKLHCEMRSREAYEKNDFAKNIVRASCTDTNWTKKNSSVPAKIFIR